MFFLNMLCTQLSNRNFDYYSIGTKAFGQLDWCFKIHAKKGSQVGIQRITSASSACVCHISCLHVVEQVESVAQTVCPQDFRKGTIK